MRWEDTEVPSPFWIWLDALSSISRILSKGLVDEKGTCDGIFASTSCWSNKPKGRGHIDVIVWGNGSDTTSPIKQKEISVTIAPKKKKNWIPENIDNLIYRYNDIQGRFKLMTASLVMSEVCVSVK